MKMMLAIEMIKRMTNSITHNQAVTSSRRFFLITCISPFGLVYYGQCWGHAQSYSHTLAQEVNVVSMMGTVCASGVLGVG